MLPQKNSKKILLTGGAGYVGSVLTAKLLAQGHHVVILDLFIYGNHPLDGIKNHPKLTVIRGDIRDKSIVRKSLDSVDTVIHLACISNDPSFELNPELSKTINYDATLQLTDLSTENGIKQFIFASSSSVYGVKKEENITENLSLTPITDYSKYKALCEEYILSKQSKDFTTTIIRPATICGLSPRQRFDLTVNILTNHAINRQKIIVFGGEQKRPNLHIEDMTDLYLKILSFNKDIIAGQIFNYGHENYKIKDIANIIKEVLNNNSLEIRTQATDDNRSYHISSEKIKIKLGVIPKYSIKDAISDLKFAFKDGRFTNTFENKIYHNIKMMQDVSI